MTMRNPGEDDVRNHGADYVFRRNNLTVPDGLDAVGVAALKALGLDFGAIDMAHTSSGWKVIEVNTACGLVGSTPQDYVKYFQEVA
jgi:glutathione synthase/RimK-type ligase-like ATP-grasp enzyme